MDLGCMDCVDKHKKESNRDKQNDRPNESSASKFGKNSRAKDAVRSSLNALNKLTFQITKPPCRKTSPISWFPRKKVEPYLERKIKMLQEVDGIQLTLDETLGDSNPHYCKILREKMAIKEAADKAMEARKAALVEASWCRILKAARIESKDAESLLSKAENAAAEAFEAARSVGVILNDAENLHKIETSSAKEEASTVHTVSATFETAFDVDKQVAAAVKAAFVKLANCTSINKDEFRELLRKISENPDVEENHDDLLDINSECEAESVSETEPIPLTDSCLDSAAIGKEFALEKHMKQQKARDSDMFHVTNVVEMMLDRLRCLKEEELASLATIVATCGLNVALAQSDDKKQVCVNSGSENAKNPRAKELSRSSMGGRASVGIKRVSVSGRRTVEAELPSLDKFLVKRLTRLEREVLEAKNARNTEAANVNLRLDEPEISSRDNVKVGEEEEVSDLGSVLLKHSSKLEKEVEEAKMNNGKLSEPNNKKFQRVRSKQGVEEVPSLDKYLVKRLTRLEREVQEAKNRRELEPIGEGRVVPDSSNTATFAEDALSSEHDGDSKENVNLNKTCEGLDQVLVKHVSKLEKAKLEYDAGEQMGTKLKRKGNEREQESSEGSLNQILVKHVSKLERAKLEYGAGENMGIKLRCNRNNPEPEGSLDQVLVKHVSKLERAKLDFAAGDQMRTNIKRSGTNREPEGSEGSLDQVMVKHVSKLERAKMEFAAAEKMESNTKRNVTKREPESSEGSLDQVLVKHKLHLEKEKIAAASCQVDDGVRHSVSRRQAREREMQAAWGGLSLGNSMQPHVSRLQRDKAAWIKAEEEERGRNEVTEVV